MADSQNFLGHVTTSSEGTAITLPPAVQDALGVGGGADVHYAIVAGVVTLTGGTPATQPTDAPVAPAADVTTQAAPAAPPAAAAAA
jgi:hypothetical protein